MHGHYPQHLWCLQPDEFHIVASFAPNGSSNPDPASIRKPLGFRYSVAYSATGIYTVTVANEFILPAQPLAVAAWPQYNALANWFECGVLGETSLNSTTRQFVIQAHRSGTANAPAANAGTRINFLIAAANNTGR